MGFTRQILLLTRKYPDRFEGRGIFSLWNVENIPKGSPSDFAEA